MSGSNKIHLHNMHGVFSEVLDEESNRLGNSFVNGHANPETLSKKWPGNTSSGQKVGQSPKHRYCFTFQRVNPVFR